MVSVYTSCFNLSGGLFDLDDAFRNWGLYSDEICIATMNTGDNTYDILKEYDGRRINNAIIKVIRTNESLNDLAFDGKLKNAALQACSNEICVQQDLDERIGGDVSKWKSLILLFSDSGYKALMFPVINVYKSMETYSDISFKWYIHKKSGCYRGIVNFAKQGEKIDIEKSDTCELIDENSNLVSALQVYGEMSNSDKLAEFKHGANYIVHLGYLDLDKRKLQNEFWKPVWENRKGGEVKMTNPNKEFFKHGIKEIYKT